MSGFAFDPSTVRQILDRARAHAGQSCQTGGGQTASALLTRLRARPGTAITVEEAAVLWSASSLATEALVDAAVAARAAGRHAPLETFAPLYLTNTCDAECRMCGMRAGNRALRRETATSDQIDEQLRTLARRGMLGVALLTGEYRGARRASAIAMVARALRMALGLGFGHVLVNAGSFEDSELATLLEGLPRRPDGGLAVDARVTMCTFQETYSRERYARFMGQGSENPRSDFDRRLTNLDRSRAAGFRVANPGILVGLEPDLGFELVGLLLHARHLIEAEMEVYLSVPRLRRVAGGREQVGASDDELLRLVAVLTLAEPAAKIVLTTREPAEMQRRLLPMVSVLSAGSAAVPPTTSAALASHWRRASSRSSTSVPSRRFSASTSGPAARSRTSDRRPPPPPDSWWGAVRALQDQCRAAPAACQGEGQGAPQAPWLGGAGDGANPVAWLDVLEPHRCRNDLVSDRQGRRGHGERAASRDLSDRTFQAGEGDLLGVVAGERSHELEFGGVEEPRAVGRADHEIDVGGDRPQRR